MLSIFLHRQAYSIRYLLSLYAHAECSCGEESAVFFWDVPSSKQTTGFRLSHTLHLLLPDEFLQAHYNAVK